MKQHFVDLLGYYIRERGVLLLRVVLLGWSCEKFVFETICCCTTCGCEDKIGCLNNDDPSYGEIIKEGACVNYQVYLREGHFRKASDQVAALWPGGVLLDDKVCTANLKEK